MGLVKDEPSVKVSDVQLESASLLSELDALQESVLEPGMDVVSASVMDAEQVLELVPEPDELVSAELVLVSVKVERVLVSVCCARMVLPDLALQTVHLLCLLLLVQAMELQRALCDAVRMIRTHVERAF